MLSENMINKLNAQINLEFYSSNLYLQMASWCEYKALDGCANFFHQHAEEETQHMKKLFNYVNETGAMAIINSIEAPQHEYSSIKELFDLTYQHEQRVTKSINELVNAAFAEKDYSSFNFLQWYVSEQHEEEKLFKSILDKINMIGTKDNGLYLIDREIAQIHKSV